MRRITCALMTVCLFSGAVLAADPLHVRIDRLLGDGLVGPAGPRSSDGEFVRRVYLDLTGMIPTVAEAKTFLADKSPTKRQALIDRLLATDRFSQRLATFYDVMLMERRGDKHVKSPEWRKFLYDSAAANKPYNQLAFEILAADGVDAKKRAPAKFFLDRDSEANLMTRDVSRIFFGMDLQCAQCHDHPLVDDYYQKDYYGIFSFVSGSYVFDDKKLKKKVLAERPPGAAANFKSVFTEESSFSGPRLPGEAPIVEPVIKPGTEYKVKPAKNVRPIPSYSRRERMAKAATSGSNRAFNRNIANRLWAFAMGRGLVDPVDLHHTDNPPSNPLLLETLADELAAMKFDVRAFLREIVLSEAYQRSLLLPENLASAAGEVAKRLAALEAESKKAEEASKAFEVKYLELLENAKDQRAAMLPIRSALGGEKKAVVEAKKKADAANKALAAADKTYKAKAVVSEAVAAAAASATAAAKKLPDEKELAAAAAKFTERSKKLVAEATALAKAKEKQMAAAKTMTDALNAATAKVTASEGKLAEMGKKVQAIDQQLATAEQARRTAVLAAKQAKSRLASATTYLEFAKLDQAYLASSSAANKLQSELTSGTQTHAKLQSELPQREKDVTTAQTALAAAAKARDLASAQLAAKQEAARLVADVAAKADDVQKKLPEAELKKTAATLAARRDQLNKEVTALTKTAADKQSQFKAAEARVAAASKVVSDAKLQIAAWIKRKPEIEKQLPAALAKSNADQAKRGEALTTFVDRWTEQFAVAGLKPLTPEQMTWSVLQVGGLIERQRAASTAEINKKSPLDETAKKDPAKVAARQREIEQAVRAKLQANTGTFIKLYGGGAGQPQNEFFATVDQALFVSNGSQIRGWLNPAGGNLADRLNKLNDPAALADELYLGVLTRYPDDREKADVAAYLKGREKEKPAAVQEMLWALLTSTEFRFNH